MMTRIPLDKIDDNPYQTRTEYGDLSDITESLLELRSVLATTSGLIHVPPARIVRGATVMNPARYGGLNALFAAEPDARVELAVGHRRVRAFRKLALTDEEYTTFPVEIALFDDTALADMAWAENEKRRDLSDIERALAIEIAQRDFDWTQVEVGRRWGLSQSAVANLLRLLKLPDKIQGLIRDGAITGRHGRALLPLVDLDTSWTTHVDIVQDGAPGQYRSVEAVERAVSDYLDKHTFDLSAVNWEAEWDPRVDGTRACDGCPQRVKVGRDWRCTSVGCLHAKNRQHNFQVVGPRRAAGVYQSRTNWRHVAESGYSRCSGCGRNSGEMSSQELWLKADWAVICPECATRAGLEPSPGAAESAEVTSAPVVESLAPAPRPAIPAPAAASYPAEPRPQPVYVRNAGDDSNPEDEPVAAPVIPVPAPQSAPLPERAVVLTARIMPGNGELRERRVLVSIGEEGHGPSAFRQGTFERLEWLVTEVLETHFAAELVHTVEVTDAA